ncbi:hypothetical protein CHLRE_06g249555v5 [Chlamydomonas reinhardtii]|uniref:Uncharacterized protein n=1 Tax=Chlamydomonas reinhardtii TaxID=3055 RepID=A0A2K3DLW3_CHLRE|nr:uncharacterized protein CHLRE_06g249555v5 [Chlamydomonas reinhardtii]PNW81508.1 hypothetical protein CHLRE_06g249555v5 [Chlamydomonas reinhardtii]
MRLRGATMDWKQAYPTQLPAAVQAYNDGTLYPIANLWLHDGFKNWTPLQPTLTRDTKVSFVLRCLRFEVDALGLKEGDSLGLLALQPGGPLMVIAACTPSGELKAGGALGGAGGAAAGVRAAAAAAAAARASTPPPPAFTAAYSISQQQQAGGSSEVLLEVTLPSLTDMGAGGSGAAGVQEPADQQRMTLLLVHVQPMSRSRQPVNMQSTPCPVTWQRQAGGDGAGGADGALLRGLPAALLPELPPQGRLLVLPAQSLAVLVAAPTQATTALAAVGAPAVAAKPQPPEVPTAAATSSSAASSSTASSSASASGHSTTRARPAATLPPLASPPLLALFTVGGPVEGTDVNGLLQLVAEEPLQ